MATRPEDHRGGRQQLCCHRPAERGSPAHVLITRLRLDARLFDPPARRRPGTVGRPHVIGKRQANLAARLANPKTRWRRLRVKGWYGRGERLVEIVTGTALWHHPGRFVLIRYVLVRFRTSAATTETVETPQPSNRGRLPGS